MYFWILGKSLGREVLMGPYNSESEARDTGFRTYDGGYFDVFCLDTRDRNRATQEIKHKKLEGGATLDEALEKIGHVEND